MSQTPATPLAPASEEKQDGKPSSSPSGPIKHPKFYFDDGSVILHVENTHCRVHLYLLEQNSPTFKEKYISPIADSSANPVVVQLGIKRINLDAFLEVLYHAPWKTAAWPLNSTYEWLRVFKVSSKFDFPEIRNLSIKKVSSLFTPAFLITLAEKHRVEEWLLCAYNALCLRRAPLTAHEVERDHLPLEHVVAITTIRDRLSHSVPDVEFEQLACERCKTPYPIISCSHCSMSFISPQVNMGRSSGMSWENPFRTIERSIPADIKARVLKDGDAERWGFPREHDWSVPGYRPVADYNSPEYQQQLHESRVPPLTRGPERGGDVWGGDMESEDEGLNMESDASGEGTGEAKIVRAEAP